MASSAKKPNRTSEGTISFQKSKQLWSEVLSGGSPMKSSVMANLPNPKSHGEHDTFTNSADNLSVDHFTQRVSRPFLTGTVPFSIVIDITNVHDKKKIFLTDLILYCQGNTHLWAVSEQIRRDNNKIFAEISVSPTLYHQFSLDPTLQLASFEEPFMAYPSLSPSAKILKVSLTGLPPQYGRLIGGQDQLKNDMEQNLQRYGAIVDCGFVTGTTGVYAGGGYVV
ncbi:hypothetical protein, partial, partial [Parasitella parasitica]